MARKRPISQKVLNPSKSDDESTSRSFNYSYTPASHCSSASTSRVNSYSLYSTTANLMAHRILTPSSPYTQPQSHQQTSSSGHHSTRPSSPTKISWDSHHSHQSHGKENSATSHRTSYHPTTESPVLPYSPSALSSPQLSTFTAAAPPPTFYSRPSPPLPPTSHHSHHQPQPQHAPAPPTMNHYHRPTSSHPSHTSSEPTVAQLLSSEPTGVSSYASRMADRDSTMANATGVVSWRKGQGFKEWEKVKLQSAEVRRKADVAQLCESLSPSRVEGSPNQRRAESHARSR